MSALAHTLLALVAFAGPTAHTSIDDVRDCAPVDRGWVAATDGGLARFDASGAVQEVITAMEGLAGTRSHVLMVDGDALWVGSEAGLTKLAQGESGLSVERTWPLDAGVRALAKHEGRVVVGSWGSGVFEVKGEKLRPLEKGERPVRANRITALENVDGVLWVATAGGGTRRLGGEFSDAPEAIWALAQAEGRVWSGGLFGAAPLGRAPEHPADARALAKVGDEVWLASYGEGIVNAKGALRGPEGLVLAQALHHDSGRTCAGGREGLWIRGEESKARTWRKAGTRGPAAAAHVGLPANDISALAHDADRDRLWVGTFDDGLARLDEGRWTRVQGADRHVNAVLVDPSGSGDVWVGGARGLSRVSPDGEVKTHFGIKDGLPGLHVLSLAADYDGSVVVGTQRGPVRLRGERLESLGRRARDWAVWAILPGSEAGELWLGTTVGLIHWRANGRWTHSSVLSGHLPDDWVTALARHGDDLYVGTYAEGVVRLRHDGRRLRSKELGGGRVNPGGLHVHQNTLWISTMRGALSAELGGEQTRVRRKPGAAPGIDVTAVLVTDGERFTASRRGLAQRRAK